MLVRHREARPKSDSVCQVQPCIMRANGLGSLDVPVQSTHIRMTKELRGCSLLSCVCVHGECIENVGISEVIPSCS